MVQWKPPKVDGKRQAPMLVDLTRYCAFDADGNPAVNVSTAYVCVGGVWLRPALHRRMDEDVLYSRLYKLVSLHPNQFGGAEAASKTLAEWEAWRQCHPQRVADIPSAFLPLWEWPAKSIAMTVLMPESIEEMSRQCASARPAPAAPARHHAVPADRRCAAASTP